MIRFEEFLRALSAWIEMWADTLLRFDTPEDGWEIIPTPWYEGPVASDVCFHLMHSASNCESLVTSIEQLADPSAEGAPADPDDILFDLSPFIGGSVTEIKYMSYEFGPLYHNVMNRFLKYMSPEDFEEAVRSSLLWSVPNGIGDMTAFAPPPAGAIASRVGKTANLSESQLLALGTRLVDVWDAAQRFLAAVDGCERFLEGPVWVGLVALNALLAELHLKIVRLEPAWAVFERASHFRLD